jgi:hypothetical protein
MGMRCVKIWLVLGLALGLALAGGAPAWAKKTRFDIPDAPNLKRHNKLSPQTTAALQAAFTGREVVLRADLLAGMLLYQGHLSHVTIADGKKPKGKLPFGAVVARAGTVAKIIGLNTTHKKNIIFFFKTEKGGRFSLPVRVHRKKMKDKYVSVAALESALTVEALRFLKAPQIDAAAVQRRLAAPPPPLSLAPAPVATPTVIALTLPTITALASVATPARVPLGAQVRLSTQFEIKSGPYGPVETVQNVTLSQNGKVLPGYPKEKRQTRGAGRHLTSLTQRIPRSARPGTYVFITRVCVRQDCIIRAAGFEVTAAPQMLNP